MTLDPRGGGRMSDELQTLDTRDAGTWLVRTACMDIGYARVSRSDQNIDHQITELADAGCERTFEEKACSGKGSVRREFEACLRTLRGGDKLVVTELSRLGRNTGDLVRLNEELRQRDVALCILNLGVDTATPAGGLIFTVIAVVAEMESALLIERTWSGLTQARAQGRPPDRQRSIADKQIERAQRLYDRDEFSVAEVARLMPEPPVARSGRYSHRHSSVLHDVPAVTSRQNPRSTLRLVLGAPGEIVADRPVKSFSHRPILTPLIRVLCRPVESPVHVHQFGEALAEADVAGSVGTKGDSYATALAATINGLYKTELIRPRKPWKGVDDVEIDTAEWVDWFNHRRLYEYRGDIPASELEAAYCARFTAHN